jgi:hypothetical protein
VICEVLNDVTDMNGVDAVVGAPSVGELVCL